MFRNHSEQHMKKYCGTQCHSLVDEEVLGLRLDLMVSKVLSHLVNSVIL